jgi:pSer/pThr/pTyr-binding forkhead associated (FHA) protein
MDDRTHPAEEADQPPPSASGPQASAGKDAFDLLPLRLTLQTSGRSIDVTQPEVLIGRHTEVDLRLPLPDVSRRHCRLVYSDGRWQIFDLNSLNGVFVNGHRVKHAFLDEHDTLRVGGFVFDVHVRSEREPEVLRLHDPHAKSSPSHAPSHSVPAEGSEKRRAG